ncbi:response regulator [Bacteroidetes/Chlorobi group bacterium MS-B_bin-24]|jgi:CheY-like chemotaxis protein|nr:MAG: response regulator [Bacteroidetes/Chlorobi group bacterium MS-B_bin-24]
MDSEKKFLVLIIDDDDLFRQYAKFILEKQLNVEVVAVKTPKEGFEFLEKNLPDLLILDMEMPVMDGYTFFRRIRADKRLEKLHVIPCTALASKDLFASLLRLGIDDYILKPVTDKILVSKVSRVLDYIKKTKESNTNESSSEPS